MRMDEFIKMLDENLDYLGHEILGDMVIIHVASNRKEVQCPYCGGISNKRHSTYERSFQDLPIMGNKCKLVINNRKMFCPNPNCGHTTFAEKFGFLLPKGKKTKRLLDKIVDVSLSTSSVAAANILKDGIVNVGKSTICNLLKKRYTPS
jgi:transposase